MQLRQENFDLFVPDGSDPAVALARTTHLCIGAHPDDIELMSFEGISACFQRDDCWFTGIVLADGANSPRDGQYQQHTAEEMVAVRRAEQRKAAVIGEYSAQLQLAYASAELKNSGNREVVDELQQILLRCQPEVVYLHSLADRHDTHVAASVRSLDALRRLPREKLPRRVIGIEVWRSLDWLPRHRQLRLDISERSHLHAALLGVFDSQIGGGKRYDLAARGRHLANATFLESHDVDQGDAINLGLDLTPLVLNPELDYRDFMAEILAEFQNDIVGKIAAVQA